MKKILLLLPETSKVSPLTPQQWIGGPLWYGFTWSDWGYGLSHVTLSGGHTRVQTTIRHPVQTDTSPPYMLTRGHAPISRVSLVALPARTGLYSSRSSMTSRSRDM
jgi:hypothetical protein